MKEIKFFAKEAPKFPTTLGHMMDRGWGNGYICVPEGHPLHGVDYNEIHNIDAHGGLTFCETGESCKSGEWGCPDFVQATDWVIGFDTAHYMDSADKWPDEASVLAEASRVADQVAEIGKLSIRQELVTRLYNLVNAATCLDGVGEPGVTYTKEDADNMLRLRITESLETLKKVMP